MITGVNFQKLTFFIFVCLLTAQALCAFGNSKENVMISQTYELNEDSFVQLYVKAGLTSPSYQSNGSLSVNYEVGYVETTGGSEYSTSKNEGLFNVVKVAASDLGSAHVYPNPCKIYEGHKFITFTDLTIDADIKIYTVSGNFVRRLAKSNATNETTWDLKNSAGELVADGIYVYLIKYGNMMKKGKIVIES